MKQLSSFNWEIECIALQRENLAIIGSNLTGNIWSGHIALFNYSNEECTPVASNSFECGIQKGLWHGGKLYIGCDDGSIYSLNQNLSTHQKSLVHHGPVLGIDKKGQNIVSADSYEFAILDPNLGIQYKLENDDAKLIKMIDQNFFIGVGKEVKVWDIRSRESKVIGEISGNPMAIALLENDIYIIEEGGSIYHIDHRNERYETFAIDDLLSSIEIIENSLLAIGTQKGDIHICQLTDSLRIKQTITPHRDSIRTLHWTGTELLSGSLDRTLKSTQITN